MHQKVVDGENATKRWYRKHLTIFGLHRSAYGNDSSDWYIDNVSFQTGFIQNFSALKFIVLSSLFAFFNFRPSFFSLFFFTLFLFSFFFCMVYSVILLSSQLKNLILCLIFCYSQISLHRARDHQSFGFSFCKRLSVIINCKEVSQRIHYNRSLLDFFQGHCISKVRFLYVKSSSSYFVLCF